MITEQVGEVADRFERSRVLRGLARTGFVTSGIVQILLGYTVLRVALRQAAESDQTGALAYISKLPGGVAILWVSVIGMGALAVWLSIRAGLNVRFSRRRVQLKSLSKFGKALVYVVLAWSAFEFATGHPYRSTISTEVTSAEVLSIPGGVFVLILGGLGAGSIGAYLVLKGVRRRFRKDVVLPEGRRRHVIDVLGVVGYVSKGISILLVGVVFSIAALQDDPGHATGLDGAFRVLAGLPFGQAMLAVIGLGLIIGGLYGFVRARYARF
jgi:hypothetical protein